MHGVDANDRERRNDLSYSNINLVLDKYNTFVWVKRTLDISIQVVRAEWTTTYGIEMQDSSRIRSRP